jgi:hypothetical protein
MAKSKTATPAAAAAPAKEKAPARAAAPAPAPNVSDKFGMLLLVLILLMLIGNLVVWSMAGAKRNGVTVFGTGMGMPTIAEYDSQVTGARVMSYSSTGMLGRLPGSVDTAVINQGSANGVRVGDVFVPATIDAKYFAEFSVTHVSEGSCIATIVTNLDLRQIADDKASGVLVNEIKPESSALNRKWSNQGVRSKIVALGN